MRITLLTGVPRGTFLSAQIQRVCTIKKKCELRPPPTDNSFEIEQRPRPNTHRPRIAVRAYQIRVSVAQQGSKEEEFGEKKSPACVIWICDHQRAMTTHLISDNQDVGRVGSTSSSRAHKKDGGHQHLGGCSQPHCSSGGKGRTQAPLVNIRLRFFRLRKSAWVFFAHKNRPSFGNSTRALATRNTNSVVMTALILLGKAVWTRSRA